MRVCRPLRVLAVALSFLQLVCVDYATKKLGRAMPETCAPCIASDRSAMTTMRGNRGACIRADGDKTTARTATLRVTSRSTRAPAGSPGSPHPSHQVPSPGGPLEPLAIALTCCGFPMGSGSVVSVTIVVMLLAGDQPGWDNPPACSGQQVSCAASCIRAEGSAAVNSREGRAPYWARRGRRSLLGVRWGETRC